MHAVEASIPVEGELAQFVRGSTVSTMFRERSRSVEAVGLSDEWTAVANSEEAIAAGGRGHNREKLTVPSKGDHLAMVEYEHALAEFLAAALKRS